MRIHGLLAMRVQPFSLAAQAIRLLAWSAMGVCLVACPQELPVWIGPGSTTRDLVFVRGAEVGKEDSVAFVQFRVYTCAGGDRPSGAVWGFELDSVRTSLLAFPSRIHYGAIPHGYVEEIAPKELLPGCYRATAGGAGFVEFEVDSAGAVRQTRLVRR